MAGILPLGGLLSVSALNTPLCLLVVSFLLTCMRVVVHRSARWEYGGCRLLAAERSPSLASTTSPLHHSRGAAVANSWRWWGYEQSLTSTKDWAPPQHYCRGMTQLYWAQSRKIGFAHPADTVIFPLHCTISSMYYHHQRLYLGLGVRMLVGWWWWSFSHVLLPHIVWFICCGLGTGLYGLIEVGCWCGWVIIVRRLLSSVWFWRWGGFTGGQCSIPVACWTPPPVGWPILVHVRMGHQQTNIQYILHKHAPHTPPYGLSSLLPSTHYSPSLPPIYPLHCTPTATM